MGSGKFLSSGVCEAACHGFPPHPRPQRLRYKLSDVFDGRRRAQNVREAWSWAPVGSKHVRILTDPYNIRGKSRSHSQQNSFIIEGPPSFLPRIPPASSPSVPRVVSFSPSATFIVVNFTLLTRSPRTGQRLVKIQRGASSVRSHPLS